MKCETCMQRQRLVGEMRDMCAEQRLVGEMQDMYAETETGR